MKLNNLTKGAITFSVLSILASGVLIASAASDNATTGTAGIANRTHVRGLGKEAGINSENMTDAQKAEMEAKKTEMDAKRSAVEAAITASDYNVWVTAEKAINENCPLLAKITADNFSKYVEANNLRKQADAIMKDLGVNGIGMGGFGQGMGDFGHGRGEARGEK